jgi:hypothetical protein
MKQLSRGLVASAAGLLLIAGLAAPAGAAHDIDDGGAITANPTSGPEGTKITVTGTGCNAATVDVMFSSSPNVVSDVHDRSDGVPVEADGTFTTTLTVHDDADPSLEYDIDATCGDENYSTIDFDVTGIRAGGALTINPTSGPPGTQVTISGTACDEDTAEIYLASSSGESGGAIESTKKDVTVAADGSFSGTVVVPEGSDPDRNYSANADCGGEAYASKAFDVTAPMTGSNGYRMVAGDGGIFTFGERTFHGSTGSMTLNKPIVGGATDTSDYDGYWIVASDGGIFTFSAPFYGSLGDKNITSPAVEIEPHPTGKGYWIVQADGTVTPFGDAKHFGDMKGRTLNKPIIGMSVTKTGMGYWLIAEDGGIFDFGDADFYGSTGNLKLNAPIVDLAPAVDNKGYYLLGRDGGVFTFGSADFKGSTGNMTLNAPVIAMLVNPAGSGYWLAATDGGIFTFGAGVDFLGSMGGTKLNSPVLDLIN